MTSYKTSSKQIVKNTGLLYVRSLFNLLLSLFTSRLVLAALGVNDYGIYNAVAGFVSMFWMITGTITSATTRFLTFELGRPEQGDIEKVFSLSLTLLIGLGLIIVLVAESFGLWFLQNKMTIPPGRENAAFWVFQTAILTSVTSLVASPFSSAIIAHEKFGLYAFVGIGETVGLFCLALFLSYTKKALDLLIVYAIVRAFISLSVQLVVTGYSFRHFDEARFHLQWDKGIFKQLFSYTSWSLLGSFAGVFSGQGINVALNVFCGPAVNAARGLTFTVTNSVGIFVNNFTSAIVPQVTKSYAANDNAYFKELVFRCSKLAFFIMLLMVVPISIEMDFVLSVWLKEVPEYVATFTRLALITSLIAMFDNILSQAQKASGIIKVYQIVISVIALCNFGFSYLLLKAQYSPVSVYIIGVLVAFVSVCCTTIISSRTLKLSIGEIVRKIYLRDLSVALVSFIPPLILFYLVPSGWIRFLGVLAVSVVGTSLCAIFIGMNKDEQAFLNNQFVAFLHRFKGA